MRFLANLGLVVAVFWAIRSEAGTFGFISNASTGSLSVVDLQTGVLLGRLAAGTSTTGLRANPSGTRIYVADTGADSVRVIDTSSGAMETVPVGDRPAGVAVTPDGSRVYVANWDDGTVSVLDGATNTVLATIPVGRNPGDLATDGEIVCVANFGGHEIVLLSVEQNLVIRRIAVDGFPGGVAMGRDTQRLFVANFLDNTVSVVDGLLGAVVGTIPVGPAPRSLLVDPIRPRLYVGNSGDGSISVIDTSTGSLVRTIQSGPDLLSDLSLSTSGDRLYAVGLGSGRLRAFDPASGAVLESISLAATGHVALGAILSLSSAPPVTPVLSAPHPAWSVLALCCAAAVWALRRRRAGARAGR